MSSPEAESLQFQLLKTITDDFADEKMIGSGGFGQVYKGVLNGKEVAVKKLFPISGLDDDYFDNEIRNLTKVQHRNIIRLIGYSYELESKHIIYEGKLISSRVIHRAMCFEYMQRGSLSNHISAESCIHDWPTTYKIIKGTCEGLYYLHKGRGEKNHIYHLDLKPDKILLDENLVPKIGGFGLSRLFANSKTHQAETIRGTIGFMPPEYINNSKITPKFDVFSLGVIIFYMIAGGKGYMNYFEDSLHSDQKVSEKLRQGLIERVQDYWGKKMQATADYTWDERHLLEVKRCIEIAMSCVEWHRAERPTIKEIINDLNNLDAQVEEMSMYLTKTLYQELYTQMGSNPHHLPLQHLKDITNNFSEERILGRGGFGVVYKGVLQDGEMVAVKKLVQAMPSSEQQFENEVNLLMKLRHPNVVRLVGYCYETKRLHTPHEGKSVFAWNTESLLCLECLPNGSLDKYLSDASSGLDWHTRSKIIYGISNGLQYLHELSEPIIHLDLKPANILLDENMKPKITDFGISRLFDQSKTIHTAITSGTRGYMPPEYLRGIITPMWDIFSLGVIIMEVITGHKDYPYDIIKDSKDFIEIELKKWRNRLQEEEGYTSLDIDCQKIERCIEIGLICVNHERAKRPTMKKVIDMLQGLESTNWYISNEAEKAAFDEAEKKWLEEESADLKDEDKDEAADEDEDDAEDSKADGISTEETKDDSADENLQQASVDEQEEISKDASEEKDEL